MRKTLKMLAMLIGSLLVINMQPAIASSIAPLSPDLPEILLDMKASEFVKLSASEFKSLVGKNISLKERVAFSVLKKNMKKALKKNPDLTVGAYLASADKKSNTALIIVIVVVAIALIVILASSAGPGSIDWGE